MLPLRAVTSDPIGQPGSPSPAGARGGPATSPARSARSSIAISRALGTVVVTVRGELDEAGARHLSGLLIDLIDFQGNLSVVVDLHDATASDGASAQVFADAAERATRRGGSVALATPPVLVDQSLRRQGLGGLIDSAVLDLGSEPMQTGGPPHRPTQRVHPAGH